MIKKPSTARRSTPQCAGTTYVGQRCGLSSVGLFEFGINGAAISVRLCATHLIQQRKLRGQARVVIAYCGPCGDEHAPGACP